MDITVQRLTTVVVDGVQEFPPATSAPVPDPLTIGTYTITANQSFTIIKSACPSECSALGAQTSPLRHSGGSIVADGSVEVPTYTTDVHGYHFRYTLGERSAVFTTASSGTLYLQEVASVATVLGASGPTLGFNAGGLVVDGTTLKPTTAATVMGMPRLPVTITDAANSMLVGYTTVMVSQAVSTPGGCTFAAPPTSNQNTTISAGSIAGIGLGCVIAGILIGALFVFLLRRQHRRRIRSQTDAGDIKTGDSATSTLITSLTNILPRPATDAQIEAELLSFYQLIRTHVRTHYNLTAPFPVSPIPDLSSLGTEMHIPTTGIASLLRAPATRSSALCLLTARTALAAIPDLPSPPSLVHALHAQDTSPEKARLWRAATAALFAPSASAPGAADSPVLTPLCAILTPFATPASASDQRRGELEHILARGVQMGWLLFAQPELWEFRWPDAAAEDGDGDGEGRGRRRGRRVVVFPGLVACGRGEKGGEREVVGAEGLRIG